MSPAETPAVRRPAADLRVAVLFHRFGPYHHARLAAAGREMKVWGLEACGMDTTYAWSKVEGAEAFTRMTLTDRSSEDRAWRRELHRQTRKALAEIRPQCVVIPGWIFPEALSALAWCGQTRTPAVIMTESTAWDEARKPWKEWLKSSVVKLCGAGLAGGTAHAEYLAELGMPRARTFLGYDIVDNDYFARAAAEAVGQAADWRQKLGLPAKFFLASARFIEKKNLFRLLEAFARYRRAAEKSGPAWDLVLLGDGELRAPLEALRKSLGLEGCVQMPGFKQYEDLPKYYGLASVFIHPSTTEQWGLVVNEAMAAGLPVLVSRPCGCAGDLVRDGENGFVFEPENVELLAGLMGRMAAADFPLAESSQASRRIIAEWGPARFGSGLRQAVECAMAQGPVASGLAQRLVLRALLAR